MLSWTLEESGDAPGPDAIGGRWRFFAHRPKDPQPHEVDPSTGLAAPVLTLKQDECAYLGLPETDATLVLEVRPA